MAKCLIYDPLFLAGLGKMYDTDERSKKNIGKHGEGTAAFAAVIETYCKKI